MSLHTSSPSASTSPFQQHFVPHMHIAGDACPVCGQDIPPEKLEEISGRIAAREREQLQAISAMLEQQYAADRAQAEARARNELLEERRQSAQREAAARDEVREAAERAAQTRLAAAEQVRLEMETVLQQQIAEAEAARTAAETSSTSLQMQFQQLQQSSERALAEAQADAKAQEADIRAEAQQAALAAAEAHVQDRLAQKEQVIAQLQAMTAETESKLAVLAEQQQATLKQELETQRDVLEQARDAAVNAAHAKAFEETQKLQSKVADLQRALDRKTIDELGEGAEVELFEALRREFPADRIERIAKGMPGADILHVVCHNGRDCGTIIYDSKNHKAFRSDHVSKLAEDQIAAHAEHAILSTHKFPKGTGQLHLQDGVLLANPARVVAVVTLIRQHMVQTHTLRMSSAERESKTAALYAFVTSERCGHLFDRVDTYAEELLDQQVKEKRWHEIAWKRNGEAVRAIQRTKAELVTVITSIIGTAAAEDLEFKEAE